MSSRNKLAKFAALQTFPNVYENFNAQIPILIGTGGVEVDMKGRWAAQHFKNDLPITLELACGRGEYALGMAQMYPQRNFIGIDIKGARIWQGAKKAIETNLHNVAFLRTRIEILDAFFERGEVSEVWITFPDPFLENRKVNRRLTSPRFLDIYKNVIAPSSLIHLKTDEFSLFEYTLETLSKREDIETLKACPDLYSEPVVSPELNLKTYFEELNISETDTIKYVQFRFRDEK